MFEAAEIGHKLSKEEFNARLTPLREQLITTQYQLRSAKFPVIILIAGVDRVGAHELITFMTGVFDSRYLQVSGFGPPTQEEAERPEYWRYWRALPPAGRMGVMLGAWTMAAVVDRLDRRIGKGEFAARMQHVRHFERSLCAEGALLLKFWLHLSPAEFKKQARRGGKHGLWKPIWMKASAVRAYQQRGMRVIEQALEQSSAEDVPWQLIESTDSHYRNLTVVETIQDEIRRRLDAPSPVPAGPSVNERATDAHTILDTVDLTQALEKEKYEKALDRAQARLNDLSAKAFRKGVSAVFVFEGWDAGGKGGCIRRVTAALDATVYRVVSIAAPTEEERAHHYLWRFWRHMPRDGHFLIFDRSWYGRVLVERVEGFATRSQWQRAYGEINEFESQISESRTALVKFWLHIDPDTQLARFKEREKTPFKQFKITEEDYRNREKWHDYEIAVNEMIARTSTRHAPWTIVPARDKYFARVHVLQTICKALEKKLS
ncbi:MAG: polyphosphate:AMP phosphotransferase [Planctomycetota bacterium]|nr:MAG: polyphosphate:AMP phosphotransferase [Planctomycetota bacterium]